MLPSHLLEFQAADAERLARPGNHILLEPPGAGKSVMAIAAAEAIGAFTIVVLCPAILRADWRAKFIEWGRLNYVFEPQAQGRRVVISSYDGVNSPERREQLLKHIDRIDVLILDEAQRLKNVEARTVASVYGNGADGTGLVALAKATWIVTGTLCPNHWGELYTHIRACFPDRLPKQHGEPISYFAFLDRYCYWEATQYGMKVLGNKAPDELRQLLQGVAIYRGPNELARLLPPLRTVTTQLPIESIDRLAYQKFVDNFSEPLKEALAAMEAGWEVTESISVAAGRHALGDLKAPAVALYVRELLQADKDSRVLVFAHHKSVLRRIAQDLSDIEVADVIDGDVAEPVRQAYIESFQRKHRRVLVLGIGTAREGITLTAANRVVFAEASWVPAHNQQAIHRAQRIGQTRPVLAEFMTVADTLDEAVMAVCAHKTRLLAEVL